MVKKEKFEDAIGELVAGTVPDSERELELLGIGVSEIIRSRVKERFTAMIAAGHARSAPVEVARAFAQEDAGYNRARFLGRLMDNVKPLGDRVRWLDRMDTIAQTEIDPLTGYSFEIMTVRTEDLS